MPKLILLSSATLISAQDTLFPIHGTDGQIKFSVNNDGSASTVGTFSAPIFDAATSIQAPSITASTELMVGETNVATSFEANAAERAAMQQTIDKLEADSAANQIAEQEQNSRVEKIEADAATSQAADTELGERVSKAEAEAEMAAKEEEATKIAEMNQAWEEKLASQEATFTEKLTAMETKHKEEHDGQQRVIDHMVKIMSRFDVSGELEKLGQLNGVVVAGGE